MMRAVTGLMAAGAVLAACGGTPGNVPGDADDQQAFSDIAEDEAMRFIGTEPFWGGRVAAGELTWTTPANIEGRTVPVERFAGRGGLSFTGQLDGQRLVLAITPGACSDGMSERNYPFVATVTLGAELLEGCAWREGNLPAGDA